MSFSRWRVKHIFEPYGIVSVFFNEAISAWVWGVSHCDSHHITPLSHPFCLNNSNCAGTKWAVALVLSTTGGCCLTCISEVMWFKLVSICGRCFSTAACLPLCFCASLSLPSSLTFAHYAPVLFEGRLFWNLSCKPAFRPVPAVQRNSCTVVQLQYTWEHPLCDVKLCSSVSVNMFGCWKMWLADKVPQPKQAGSLKNESLENKVFVTLCPKCSVLLFLHVPGHLECFLLRYFIIIKKS